MKFLRYVAALLLFAVLLSTLLGCGYSPVPSSEEELTTVFTLDGEKFSVPYELYRFFFLSELALSEEDPTKLSPDEKNELFDVLHLRTMEEITAVYAVLSLCQTYNIDIYSDAFDDAVADGVISAVEGDDTYLGYGDHESYLAAIKEAYMNDSVFRFLLRYQHAERVLASYLRDNGILKSDEQSVMDYMRSDECVRASWLYIPYTMLPNFTAAQLSAMEEEAKASDNEAFLRMTHRVISDVYTDSELDIGFYMGKYQLDPYYQNLTDTVFSLAMDETSSWIDAGDGKYLVRRLPKEESYLSERKNLADFTEYYLLNSFYGLLAEEGARLMGAVDYTVAFSGIGFESLKMPD